MSRFPSLPDITQVRLFSTLTFMDTHMQELPLRRNRQIGRLSKSHICSFWLIFTPCVGMQTSRPGTDSGHVHADQTQWGPPTPHKAQRRESGYSQLATNQTCESHPHATSRQTSRTSSGKYFIVYEEKTDLQG